ncbi:MAG TPA: ABC transporter permease [Candidatus Limnocylindrales bacterium]|nr:ABC transporter permease [Candidatus Limnocylindrales bacterium]
MRNVLAIAWRDIRAVFVSPIAYVVLTGFTLLSGWFFFNMLGQFIRLANQYAMLQGMDTTWLNLNDAVIAPLFHNLLFVLLIVIPMITMRSFSEEKNQSTFELLFTSPVRISEMVIGKFLAGAALVTLMVFLSFLFPALLFVYGNPEPGMMLAGALALYLTALSFVAVGNFTSALTSNQIIATISALVILLLLFVINWPAEGAGEKVAGVLGYLSVSNHFNKMAKGVIETTDLIYFASVTAVFLFLTHRAVESSRWK